MDLGASVCQSGACFIVAADASSVGIGAVLLQIQDGGRRRPVWYACRSIAETEKRYAVIEKEALNDFV